jgi:hypothetical protein
MFPCIPKQQGLRRIAALAVNKSYLIKERFESCGTAVIREHISKYDCRGC